MTGWLRRRGPGLVPLFLLCAISTSMAVGNAGMAPAGRDHSSIRSVIHQPGAVDFGISGSMGQSVPFGPRPSSKVVGQPANCTLGSLGCSNDQSAASRDLWAVLPSGCLPSVMTSIHCSRNTSATRAALGHFIDLAGTDQSPEFPLLVNSSPVATIHFSAARGCGGGPASPVMFWVTVTGGTPGYRVAWNFGDHHTAVGNRTVHAFNGPGTFEVSTQVTDSAGVATTDTAVVQLVQAAHCGGSSPVSNSWFSSSTEIIAIGVVVAVILVEVGWIAYRRSR